MTVGRGKRSFDRRPALRCPAACIALRMQIELGLRPQSPRNGNISSIGRRLSAISGRKRPNLESRDPLPIRKSLPLAGFSASARPFSRAAGMPGWGGRIRTSRWRIGNRTLSPVREKPQNPFPLKFITNSKRWKFENRIELVESRASERNGPFGE